MTAKGPFPNLQTLQTRAASESQSSPGALSLLSLPVLPTLQVTGGRCGGPRARRSAGGDRPLSALCWQDRGWKGFAAPRPQTSGRHRLAAGLPGFNPLCLHNRYPARSCPSPSTFCFGFLQLSKYFSYLLDCIHVQLHIIKEPPIILHKTRGKNCYSYSVGTQFLLL